MSCWWDSNRSNLDNWITKQPWTFNSISFGLSGEWCRHGKSMERTEKFNLNNSKKVRKRVDNEWLTTSVSDRTSNFWMVLQNQTSDVSCKACHTRIGAFIWGCMALAISNLSKTVSYKQAWRFCFIQIRHGSEQNAHFIWEFDPGSGWTLAACLTHASRTKHLPRSFGWLVCDWVADGWVTRG